MHFEWDEAKNRANQSKHQVSFELASRVFDDPLHHSVRDRIVAGEERWQTMGMVGSLVVVLVAHTYHDDGNTIVIRIISARKATRHERKAYEDEAE